MAQLAANYPTSTFNDMPKGAWTYGGGGINSSGIVCGNFNAGAAILAQLGAPASVKNQWQRWFENTYLPTNASYVDYAGGTWTPGGSATGGWGSAANQLLAPLNNCPKVKPNSLGCHSAHTRWKAASSSWIAAKGVAANSDRCSKTSYDAAYAVCVLINDWKAGVTIPGTLDPSTSATGCKTPGCHAALGTDPISGTPRTGVSGQLKCEPCHTQRMGDGHNL